jgi:hypothetical protein
MNKHEVIQSGFERGQGILRLFPVFVPRRFSVPGKRLRLHPDDYFAYGVERGAIKERWFSSVIPAMNGKKAKADEGMSYVLQEEGDIPVLLKEYVDELGADLIGEELNRKYGTWPMYSKFFDYNVPLFHHLHLSFESADRVGRLGKPESYYFPPELNNHLGTMPVSFFGYDPDTSREDVLERLLQYEDKDNRITELSRAYRIQLGTGWYTPPGVVHAPGSVLTYEPQWNSDVNSVHENVASDEAYPYDFLVENCPENKKRNIEYIMSLMDWEKNIDPHYKRNYFRPPILVEHGEEKFEERWISYGNEYIAAKELRIAPGSTIRVKDPAAYGCIIIQGYGSFGPYQAAASTMLRFGQMSEDEFFVAHDTAGKGVLIENKSRTEPMVILKHFGPNSGAPSHG